MSNVDVRAALPHDPLEMGIGLLFDAVLDAIVVSRSDGVIAFWNASAERILGYSAQEARGMNVDKLIPPEFLDAHHAGIQHFRETGRGRLIEAQKPIEVPAIRKDGERIWVDLTLSRVDYKGEPYAIAILRDVTERVAARESREKAAKQLHDAYESLEAFSSVVAHDLKEPVRAMDTYLRELREEKDAAQRDELVDRALGAHQHLQRLLGGLLEWSRTLTAPLDVRKLDLARVLSDPGNAAQWQSLANERGARIEIAPDIPLVRGTEDLVTRVFGNLITNAIKHNPSAEPTVQISGSEVNARVRIHVDDDGLGFPAATLRASRAQPVRTIKSGFGLAITRRALDRLQGTLRLENRPEGGGRAIVELPSARAGPTSAIEERVRELV